MSRSPDTDGTRAASTNDDHVMTRSEEELRIMTRRRETRRARLTKRVETRRETVTHTVELAREQVEIEYLPLDDGVSAAGTGERWLVLYEEEVVVQTRWVARERVRLTVHSVSEHRPISDVLRTERLAVDRRDALDLRDRPSATGSPS